MFDSWSITGQSNQASCNYFGGGNCPEMQFKLTATTVPWNGFLEVTSLKGEINGQWFSINGQDGYMVGGLTGSSSLAQFTGPIPFTPPNIFYPLGEPWFYFLYNGQRGQFGLDDTITGAICATGFGQVTWDAVQTPEPSAAVLLFIGFLLVIMRKSIVSLWG
jgi:hypothetical protein